MADQESMDHPSGLRETEVSGEDKLQVAAQSARSFLGVCRAKCHGPGLSEDMARLIVVFKLLAELAKEIEWLLQRWVDASCDDSGKCVGVCLVNRICFGVVQSCLLYGVCSKWKHVNIGPSCQHPQR